MDELLHSRVEQLKEIFDRLHRIRTEAMRGDYDGGKTWKAITDLQADVNRMIEVAEAEHAAF